MKGKLKVGKIMNLRFLIIGYFLGIYYLTEHRNALFTPTFIWLTSTHHSNPKVFLDLPSTITISVICSQSIMPISLEVPVALPVSHLCMSLFDGYLYPPLDSKLHEGKNHIGFCSIFYLLVKCLIQSRYLVNTCWIN